MSALRSKVRLYDLAKELKVATKRLITEVRAHGVDISVPSNSISKELADKIRDKYFPKRLSQTKRQIKLQYKNSNDVEHPQKLVRKPFIGPLPEGFAVTNLRQQLPQETPPLKKKKIRRCPLCPNEMTTKLERRRHFISDHPEQALGGKLLSSLKARELCDLIPVDFGDLASVASLAGFTLRRESDEVPAHLFEELAQHVRLAKQTLDALRATTKMDLARFDELAQRDFGVVRKLIDDCLKGRPIQREVESFATEDADTLTEYARILEWKISGLPANSLATRIVRRINEDIEIYIKRGGTRFGAKNLNWKLLPKGKQRFKKLVEHFERISKQQIPTRFDMDRLHKVHSLRPDDVFAGIDQFEGYVVFYFVSAETAVLDCPVTGNAIYVFGKKWKSLSRLTKTALLNDQRRDVTRIVHHGAWFSKLKSLVKMRQLKAELQRQTAAAYSPLC